MPKYLNIEIPQSCHENWNTMQPNEQGRHCFSCKKTVVDFTAMSDAELINFFSTKKENVCGRFTNEQLDRDILIPQKKYNWFKYLIHFTIPALLLAIKDGVKAATNTLIKTEQHPTPSNLIKSDTIITQKRIISGKVVSEKGEEVPFASVVIKGTQSGVACDNNGSFTIRVPEKARILVISSIGFSTIEVSIDEIAKMPSVVVALSSQPTGEVVITTGYVVRSTRKKKKQKHVTNQQEEKQCSATIYPNPIASSGKLNINLKNAELGFYTIQISNLQSQLIQTEKIELTQQQSVVSFDLKSTTTGNYVVNIIHIKSGKRISNQLIVQ